MPQDLPTNPSDVPEPTPPSKKSSSEDPLIEAALRQLGGSPAAGGVSPSPSAGPDSLIGIPPDLFPGFIVVREIHRGGQGVVYQAIHKATKRKVAIKVMKEGPFAGHKEKARFDREVEVLAQLNHPNIVTVHDSGVLPPDKGGMHFFVMDYISGKSLDTFLEDSKLDLKETIAVFAKICDAVNAAHLKGVIHRDLKPTNIRVDANGEPHVLDFGLAKVAGGSLMTDGTPELMTMTGQFIGSPAWASPEQAVGDISKIDVRTDVYSLGVMLYKALTHQFPYAVVGMLREVLDNIEKALPQRPSTVSRKINDEVETILLKALSKERERRYQNAGELGRDLRNYLTGQPIEAKRDSVWYLVRKAAAQHRMGAFAATAVLVSLIAGFVVSFSYWRKADVAFRAEQAAKVLAQEQKSAAELARDEARRHALRAERVTAFVNDMFGGAEKALLTGSGPEVLIEVLRQGDLRAVSELGAEPLVQASVLDVIGRAYLAIDETDLAMSAMNRARDLRQNAAGANALSPDLADSYESLSELWTVKGSYQDAMRELDKALPIRKAVNGEDSLAFAKTEHLIGRTYAYLQDWRNAEKWFGAAIDRAKRLAPDSLEVAEFQCSLGFAYKNTQEWDKAIPILQSARATSSMRRAGEDNIPGVTIKQHLIDCLLARNGTGDKEEAIRLAQESVATCERLFKELNPKHPWIARAHAKLAKALAVSGRNPDAEREYLAALDVSSGDHKTTKDRRRSIYSALIKIYDAVGDSEKARAAREQLDAIK